MSDNEPILSSGDKAVLRAAQTGEGLIPLTPDLLKELMEAAKTTWDHFQELVAEMTQEQANYVRRLRVDKDYSWRAVAGACYKKWDGDWYPDDNQVMGMALCERAAGFFGEDYMETPWN